MPTRPKGHHHGDLRNALERAALELVGERGPSGFTLAEASRRAGVSVAAPYKHFADRESLLVAVAVAGHEELRGRCAAAIASTDRPVEQLAAYARAYVRFAAEKSSLFRLMTDGSLPRARHPALASAAARGLDRLVPAARGAGGGTGIDLAVDVAAAAHGVAALLLAGTLGARSTVVADAQARADAITRTLAAAAS